VFAVYYIDNETDRSNAMSDNATYDNRHLDELQLDAEVTNEDTSEPPEETDDDTWHLPPDEYEENGI
jgi:hypothetical protein